MLVLQGYIKMGCGSSAPVTVADKNNNEKVVKISTASKINDSKKEIKEDTKDKKAKDELPELKQEPTVENVDVPLTEPGYPAIHVVKDSKAVFNLDIKMRNIDEHAKVAPNVKADSFEDLIQYLKEKCTSDVEKVRALFVWLGSQDIENENYDGVTNSDTPRGFMKLIKENKLSYSSFFAVLCRRAGIPCAIIHGYAKSVSYEVGDPEDRVLMLCNTWNAVYVAGSWRIVFPRWAFTGVTGFQSGQFTKVEAKGKAVREKEQQAQGISVRQLNEYYFFPDPEHFIYKAMPKESRWQLLSRPWTMKQFTDVPLCTQVYFEERIAVTSKLNGRLTTVNGMCNVQLTCETPANMKMNYELYYNHVESGRELSSSLQLNNYVFLNRTESLWDFSVRFPETGVYKLQIVGGRNYECDICSFKIFCNESQEDCKPLPFNPGNIGYGPNLETELAGLTAVSHKNGLVKVFARKQMQFNFNVTRDVIVKSEIIHNSLSKEELQSCIQQTQKNRNVNVIVTIPESGEYALTMHTQQKNDGTFKNVCNYLLTSEDSRKKKNRSWENPIEKRTRGNVQQMSKERGTKHVEELERELDKALKLDLADKDGDIAMAQETLELKKDQKALEDAVKRRHLQILEDAIKRGYQSKFKDKLIKQITEAETVRDHLKTLNRLAHDILEMKQTTIAELRSYKLPAQIIVDIMRSTFLMLGEKAEFIEDWEDLQMLMGKTGKDKMLRRVKEFDTINVQPDTVYRVQQTINKYTETDARIASAGAGTFYVWLRNVCEVIEKQDSN